MPRAAVIVAHPDDEMLWCGGFILEHPGWEWFVLTLCRASDTDRAPRFERVLHALGAKGAMGDLDDGPDQSPLPPGAIRDMIDEKLPPKDYDVVLTHGPRGEYTRHRRHEECCRAVVSMWEAGGLRARRMMLFAYEDESRTILPRVRDDADEHRALGEEVLARKRMIVTDLYGFAEDSWEAKAVPASEGFYVADEPAKLVKLIQTQGVNGP